jgi:tetratricopeptide (TPR) repeat protein
VNRRAFVAAAVLLWACLPLPVARAQPAEPPPDAQLAAALAQSAEAAAGRTRLRELVGAAAVATGRAQAPATARAWDFLSRVDAAFDAAAQGYRAFLAAHPTDPRAYEVRYRLAEALAGARHHDHAARVFAGVAASSAGARFRAPAAYLAVQNQEAWIRQRTPRGEVDACTALRAGIPFSELTNEAGVRLLTEEQERACTGSSIELPIPDFVRTLIDLRTAYIERVAPELDIAAALGDAVAPDAERPDASPPFRAKFAYLNARTMWRFGHAAEAEAAYRATLATHCADPTVAAAAFDDLNNLLVQQGRQADREALARQEQERVCPLRDDPCGLGVERAVRSDLPNVLVHSVYRHPLDLFRRAESASWAEAFSLYEQAAEAMDTAVRAAPRHPSAALASYYAALSLERGGQTTRALARYLQIIREYDLRGSALPGYDCATPVAERLGILEAATFRAAVNARRLFVPDLALRLYRVVIDDPRFAATADHAEHLRDARAAITEIAWERGLATAAAAEASCEAPSPDAVPRLSETLVAVVGHDVRPRPDPSPAQVEALRMLEAEAEAFIARGRQFRADVERLATAREEVADRLRRTLMVPGPLAAPPLSTPAAPILARRDSATAAVAALDEAAPGTARYVDALTALAESLARPDPRLDARCRPLVVALAGAPVGRRAPIACAALLHVVRPGELAPLHLPGTALSPPWTPTLVGTHAWRPALLLQLAADALHQQRAEEGVAFLRVFRALYPLDRDGPAAADRIVGAFDGLGRADRSAAAQADFVDFAAGSPWHCAHRHDGALIRRTGALVARHLRRAAAAFHERAERLRRAASRDPAARADDELSARLLATCIAADPNGEDADDLRLRRAIALAGAAHHDEAAEAYSALARSSQEEDVVARAARGARVQRRAHVIALVARGELDACSAVRAGIGAAALVDGAGRPRVTPALAARCEAIPDGVGTSVNELAIPQPIRALMDARLESVSTMSRERAAHETATADDEVGPGIRPEAVGLAAWLSQLNALTLLRFGHVREAESLLRERLSLWPCGPVANESYRMLRTLFARQGRDVDAAALENERRYRRCAGGVAPCPSDAIYDRSRVEIMHDAVYRQSADLFHQAEQARPEVSRALYERVVQKMDRALRANPIHPQAALAHFYVALALERSGRWVSAAERYARITREFDSTLDAAGRELCGEALAQRINVLELATYRAAVNAERNYDFDAAVAHYRAVVEDPRFAGAVDHDAHVHDALASIAMISTNLGHWRAATAAWTAFEPFSESGRERAEVRLRLAQIPYREGRWRDAVRSLEAFARGPSTADTVPLQVWAWSLVAECHRRLSDGAGSRAALVEAVRVFHATGLSAGSMAAARAVARLPEFDALVAEILASRPEPGVDAGAAAWRERIATLDRDIEEMARLSPIAVVGARVRLGEAYERLATMAEASTGEASAVGSAGVRPDWRARAVEHYLTAVRDARRDGMPSPTAERALDRAHASENREPLTAVLTRWGRSIERPGIFDENPPGALLLESGAVATPPLVELTPAEESPAL